MHDQKIVNASFLGALSVVLIHIGVDAPDGSLSWWFYQMTANGFCRWAVPFFFATTGYFLAAHIDEHGWWLTAVRKRVRTLLMPFILWNLLYAIYGILLTVVANHLAGRVWSANLRTGWDVLMYFGLHPLKGGGYGVLWFVETLFLFVIVSPLLVWLIRRLRWFVPLLLCGLCYAGLPGLPHNFNAGWMMYFAAGIAARISPVHLRRYWGGAIVIGMIWIWHHKAFMLSNGITDRWDSTPLLAVVMVLIGVWALVPRRLWLPRFMTSATFAIYVMHCIVLGVVGFVLPPVTNTVFQILRWMIAIAVCIGATWCLRRYLPKTASVLLGGR